MKNPFFRTKLACYSSNVSMSVVGNLSPLLFITFREMYQISYALLGFLVLLNFVTQLCIDLIFSFFSHKFNISKVVKTIPLITTLGLAVYGLWPFFFPNHVYVGLVIGTLIFAAAGGLGEVLISPVIAAIPADDPDHEMSKLHSVYAWGVVFAVLFSTMFLLIFGAENWQYLALVFTLIPLTSAVLFAGAKIPFLGTPERVSGAVSMLKNKTLWLCFAAIFLGGAAECTMAQWMSGYVERSLGISKVWGDIFGLALFSVMMGLGRTLYSKIGKNIERVLLLGAIGSVVCYATAVISPFDILGLFACAFTGLCVSMMWPGSLIIASDRIPVGGVFVFAMMAAGGDSGAALGPQLVGVVTDLVVDSQWGTALAQNLDLTPDQLGMKCGMLVGVAVSVIAVVTYAVILKTKKTKQKEAK